MWLVKYLLFFSSAIVSVVGAGAVVAGIIVFLIFDRLLPSAIFKILKFEFLEALPMQLSILGMIVCLSTIIGCCGAILEGKVGKWLLITYTIELTTFVALNILVAVVMHLGHQKTSSSCAVAYALTMDPRTKLIDATYSGNVSSHLTEATDEMPSLLRQRRNFFSNVVHSTKEIVHDTTNAVGEQIHRGKSLAEKGINNVGNTVKSGATAISNAVDSAVDTAQSIGGGLNTATAAAVTGMKLVKDAAELVLSTFKELNSEEEKAVKWIRPILGIYTGPVFRLTNSTVVMSTWAIAIGVETIFIVLNIYLSTTKNRSYEAAIEGHDFVEIHIIA